MPKSRIIKDIANGIVDLETSLNQLYLLANDINDSGLMEWVQNELQGYPDNACLPSYRIYKSMVLRYSGLSGTYQVKNALLQPDLLKKEIWDNIKDIRVGESIRSIVAYEKSEKEMVRDLSWLASEVYEESEQQIQATRISQIIPSSAYQDIIAAVKLQVIKKLIGLERKHGCLDTLEIQNDYDPEVTALWSNIHEQIKMQSKDLYTQNFFGAAADRAVKTVETYLRKMYRDLKGTLDPRNIRDIIGALLSENGIYYCDTTSQDGINFRKGFVELTQGFFSAYRNPLSHNNQDLTKREAFELIVLSSMILEVLDQDDNRE